MIYILPRASGTKFLLANFTLYLLCTYAYIHKYIFAYMYICLYTYIYGSVSRATGLVFIVIPARVNRYSELSTKVMSQGGLHEKSLYLQQNFTGTLWLHCGNVWLCLHADSTERFHLVSNTPVYALEVLFKFHKSCHISGYSQYGQSK